MTRMTKSKTPQAEFVTVTPEMASQWLAEMDASVEAGAFRQRSRSDTKVRQYSQDMLEGYWGLTHQGIAFDETGNMLDGQHRCEAIVLANRPVKTLVVTGLPEIQTFGMKTMDLIDTGKNRSVADQLHVSHAYANAGAYAKDTRAIVEFCLRIPGAPKTRKITKVNPSVAMTLAILEKLGVEKILTEMYRTIRSAKMRPTSVVAPLSLYWMGRPRKAAEFLNKFATLSELPADHPVLQLDRYFRNQGYSGRAGGSSRIEVMRSVANAISYFDEGTLVRNIRPSEEAQTWLLKQNAGFVKQIHSMFGISSPYTSVAS